MRKPRLTNKVLEGIEAALAHALAGETDELYDAGVLPQVEAADKWIAEMMRYRAQKKIKPLAPQSAAQQLPRSD